MHPLLAQALRVRGRNWGTLNSLWLERKPDYSHGSPAFKKDGHFPPDAPLPDQSHEWTGRFANKEKHSKDV